MVALLAHVGWAETLTLEDVLKRARESAPAVQVASRLVQEAEATRIGAGVPLTNPRLFVDYRRLATELEGQPVDPRDGFNLGLDGTFEVSGAGFLRVEEAERRVTLARSELRQVQIDVAATAWVTWIDALLADQRVHTLEEILEVTERVEAAARERLSLGVAGEPDVTTVTAELGVLRAQLIDANRRKMETRLRLAQLLDLAPDTPMELTVSSLEPREPQSEDALLQQALERRPELAALRARLALLDLTDSRLFREAIPHLGYNVGVDAAPASPAFAFVGISVALPVAQRNQGARALTQAQRETERSRLDAQLRRVRREVAIAHRNYEARRRELELLTTTAVPAARRTQALIEQGWRAGRFDIFRLTTATRDALRLEQERLETLLAAWNDFIELQRASGGLNP